MLGWGMLGDRTGGRIQLSASMGTRGGPAGFWSVVYNRSVTADVWSWRWEPWPASHIPALRAESPRTFCLLAAAAEVEVEDGDVANARQDSDHQGHDEGQDPQHKHPGDGR